MTDDSKRSGSDEALGSSGSGATGMGMGAAVTASTIGTSHTAPAVDCVSGGKAVAAAKISSAAGGDGTPSSRTYSDVGQQQAKVVEAADWTGSKIREQAKAPAFSVADVVVAVWMTALIIASKFGIAAVGSLMCTDITTQVLI